MPIGSLQLVPLCMSANDQPSSDVLAGSTQVNCVLPDSTVGKFRIVQAYVLDPGRASAIEASMGELDYTQAAGLYAVGLTSVVGLYLVAESVSSVLGLIRRG